MTPSDTPINASEGPCPDEALAGLRRRVRRRRPTPAWEPGLNPFTALVLLVFIMWTLGVVALIWACERLSDAWDWARGGPRRMAWAQAKQQFPVGRRVEATVTAHRLLGIVVDVGDPVATGMVVFTDPFGAGRRRVSRAEFPQIGTRIAAVVVGHRRPPQAGLALVAFRPAVEPRRTSPRPPTRPASRRFERAGQLSGVVRPPRFGRPPGYPA
jgi:hypothetical protein